MGILIWIGRSGFASKLDNTESGSVHCKGVLSTERNLGDNDTGINRKLSLKELVAEIFNEFRPSPILLYKSP